ESDAENILSALGAKSHVVAAAIYGPDGKLFAKYVRKGVPSPPLPRQASAAGYRLEHGYMVVFQPVLDQNHAVLGTVFIRSDMQEAAARLRQYVGFTLLILLGSLLIAFALSSQLQRAISGPILDLAHT